MSAEKTNEAMLEGLVVTMAEQLSGLLMSYGRDYSYRQGGADHGEGLGFYEAGQKLFDTLQVYKRRKRLPEWKK